MNKMDYLDSIYSDFFGDNIVKMKTSNSNESKEDKSSLLSKIDALYITDESKELLKKIIDYMNKYKCNDTDIYIPIRLIINSNSDKTIKDVIEILSLCSKNCSYTKNNDYLDYSLYKMNKKQEENHEGHHPAELRQDVRMGSQPYHGRHQQPQGRQAVHSRPPDRILPPRRLCAPHRILQGRKGQLQERRDVQHG